MTRRKRRFELKLLGFSAGNGGQVDGMWLAGKALVADLILSCAFAAKETKTSPSQ